MKTKNTCICRWAAPFVAAALFFAWSCDQDYPTQAFDAIVDSTLPDAVEDLVPDAEPEPEPDPVEETPPACTYPTGTYAFSRVGDLVAPVSWPTAVSGSEETLPADFEVLYCDESVQSIFVMISTSS